MDHYLKSLETLQKLNSLSQPPRSNRNDSAICRKLPNADELMRSHTMTTLLPVSNAQGRMEIQYRLLCVLRHIVRDRTASQLLSDSRFTWKRGAGNRDACGTNWWRSIKLAGSLPAAQVNRQELSKASTFAERKTRSSKLSSRFMSVQEIGVSGGTSGSWRGSTGR